MVHGCLRERERRLPLAAGERKLRARLTQPNPPLPAVPRSRARCCRADLVDQPLGMPRLAATSVIEQEVDPRARQGRREGQRARQLTRLLSNPLVADKIEDIQVEAHRYRDAACQEGT